MSLAKLKKELNTFDKNNLIELITELYKKNSTVKEYLDFFVNTNEDKILHRYRKKIANAFNPTGRYALKLNDAKQAIADFKKTGLPDTMLADLMLFYAESAMDFTNTYGDVDDPFYASLAKMYSQALHLLNKEDALEKFRERALKVMDMSGNIGWGMDDYITNTYYQYFYTEE